MINSTLGGLIKDYRLQKGLSQLDIAFALGWKETSRISRIEQGRTERPPRELLDKIIAALRLEDEEKNTLLLIGGYLPAEEEILKVKKETDKLLKKWPYPAVMIDFSWRVIDSNTYGSELFRLPEDVYKSQIRVLDVGFRSFPNERVRRVVGNQQKEAMFISLKEVIIQFKYEQRYRTRERWYIEHIKRLMENDLFRSLWVEANPRDAFNIVLGKHAIKQFIHPKDKNKLLSFYLFIVPVLRDPRFEVELHAPVDLETFNVYR